MKYIVLMIVALHPLFALYLSEKIPSQAIRFVDSFECFSDDDKTMIYTYMQALEYRIDHVDRHEDLEKSDLDYWRLWHILSDIQDECKLHYKFDNILEEIITPTDAEKEVLKKLRRVESGIRTDGASELSARMRKYDVKLKANVLANKPKYIIEKRSNSTHDYDLSSLKTLPSRTIPKNVYDYIMKLNTTTQNKALLFRSAYLEEETIRSYDQPKKRHQMKQEMLYLKQCMQRQKVYLKADFQLNFKRKLAYKASSYSNYYPLKQEFLPKEIQTYCDNNITAMTLAPVAIAVKKNIDKKIQSPKFVKAQKVVDTFKGDQQTKREMQSYLKQIKSTIGKQDGNIANGLQIARLQNCFKGVENFQKALFEDIQLEHLKDDFSEYVLKPQMWWMMTIAMKIKAEGESEELIHFFDCNQTTPWNPSVSKPLLKKPANSSGFTASDMGMGISQKDSILKYYSKIFENKPTPDFSNKKAMQAGIIESQWINEKNEITAPFGDNIFISGMTKGGMRLTYTGIPRGKLCSDFINLNFFDTIHFNNSSYDGIDYVLLNENKIKMHHKVNKHVERLCDKQDKNTISFVKEETVKKHEYKPEDFDSAFGIAKKIKVIDEARYAPNSFVYSKGSNHFFVIGNKAKMYDKQSKTYVLNLPRNLENSYDSAFSPNGELVAVGRGTKIYIWSVLENKIVRIIDNLPKEIGNVVRFLSDNKTLVVVGKSIHFINIENSDMFEVTPHFIEKDKKYFTPKVSAIGESVDGSTIYIGSSYGDIERWRIEKGLFGFGDKPMVYIDTLEDKQSREIGAIIPDPRNSKHLIVGTGQKIRFWDLKKKQIIKTLYPDTYMSCKAIQISRDQKYLLASGNGIFIWKLDSEEQYEILNGDTIKGALFVNEKEFISVGREVILWSLE